MITVTSLLQTLMILSPLVNHVMPASLPRTPTLFEPSLYAWKNSNFSLPPEKDSIIIQYDLDEEKVQVLDWQRSNLNIPKGVPFVGYLYFRAKTPIGKAIEILPAREKGRILTGSKQLDYCVAIDIENDKLVQIPGYNGQSIAAACVSCDSTSCPDSHLPCRCGWRPYSKGPHRNNKPRKLPFIGVTWWAQTAN